MIVTGIIAEYNPFHNGHAYQLSEARRLTHADFIVVVMSGDYVQRGTPAILEKHLRAKAALENGADLVLELPVRFATASARDFSSGAVRILNDLGLVNYLCFGSESGDIRLFQKVTALLTDETSAYQTTLRAALKEGLSYPAAHQKALLEMFSHPCLFSGLPSFDPASFLCAPNNILGLEYLRALQTQNSPIIPITIKRTGSHYHSENLSAPYASATAIRHALLESNEDFRPQVPPSTLPLLESAMKNHLLLTEDDFSLPLNYALLLNTPETLSNYLDIPAPLCRRIYRELPRFHTYSQFAALLKTKEITRTRINRALLHIVLQLKADQTPPTPIRVLGFHKTARPLLTRLKQTASTPIITKLTKTYQETYAEDLFASNLYHRISAFKQQKEAPDERSLPIVIL